VLLTCFWVGQGLPVELCFRGLTQAIRLDSWSGNIDWLPIKLLLQYDLCMSNLMQPKMKAMWPLEA
jgi:hypothetical protein